MPWVVHAISASELNKIYKAKSSKSRTVWTQTLYINYDTNSSKCPCLATTLEQIMTQSVSVSDLQLTIRQLILLSFLHESLMSIKVLIKISSRTVDDNASCSVHPSTAEGIY